MKQRSDDVVQDRDLEQSEQIDPRALDAEMITRLPVATAKDHHYLFVAVETAMREILENSGRIGGFEMPYPSRRPADHHGARAEPAGRRES